MNVSLFLVPHSWKRTQSSLIAVALSLIHDKLPPPEDLWQFIFSNGSSGLSF